VVLVNEQEHPAIDGRFVSLGRFRFENNPGYVMISNEGRRVTSLADAVVFLPQTYDSPSPRGRGAGTTATLKELEAELKKLQDSGPKREMVMTVREEKPVGDIKIHIPGSVHSQGEKAPRGFLQVASTGAGRDPRGRRAAAASSRTGWRARESADLAVLVNRVWHWLFARALVRTTDNFGTTGETPSHPELLDHLALRFDGS